jgi:hypothetical protein
MIPVLPPPFDPDWDEAFSDERDADPSLSDDIADLIMESETGSWEAK